MIVGKKKDEQKTLVIRGEISLENMKWLSCSVVGEGLRPLRVSDVEMKLKECDLNFEMVREIDSYKVLITFKIEKEAIEFVSKANECLRPEIEEVRQWTYDETCKMRRVWIKCVGLPIQG